MTRIKDIPKLVTNSHEGLTKEFQGEGVEQNPPLLNSAFSLDYVLDGRRLVQKGSKVCMLFVEIGQDIEFQAFFQERQFDEGGDEDLIMEMSEKGYKRQRYVFQTFQNFPFKISIFDFFCPLSYSWYNCNSNIVQAFFLSGPIVLFDYFWWICINAECPFILFSSLSLSLSV
jgi:hypothetical protein